MQNTTVKAKSNRGRRKENPADKVDYDYVATLAASGLTDRQMAVALRISEGTVNNYKKDPQFLEVLKNNKRKADETVERSLWERATGYSYPSEKIFCNKDGLVTRVEYTEFVPPDPTSMIFWLKNRQPAQWKDRREVTTTININNIDFTKLTPDELTRIASDPDIILSTSN